MAVKLNLLPPEYVVAGPLANVLKTIRALGVIFLAGFLIFALGLGVFFIISSLELRNLESANSSVKSQISASEQSEQQVVLLKDRLKKIKTAQGVKSSSQNLSQVSSIVSSIVGSGSLTELSADSQKVDISINFKTNSDLVSFLTALKDSKVFKSVTMTTFGFNPLSGYLVSIRLM